MVLLIYLKKNWSVVGIFFIAALIKFYLIFIAHNPQEYIYSDMQGYIERAHNVLNGTYGLLETIYPPGYHFFLAVALFLGKSESVLVFSNFWLGLLLVVVTYKLGRLFFNSKIALGLTILTAVFHKLNIIFGYYISENLFVVLLLLTFYFLIRYLKSSSALSIILFSFFIGVSSITRGEGIIIYVLLLVYLIFCDKKINLRRILLSISVVLTIILLSSFYFTYITKKVTFISNNSGLAAAIGWCKLKEIISHNPPGYTYVFYATPGEAFGFKQSYSTDVSFTNSLHFWRKAVGCIRKDPFRIVTKLEVIRYLFNSQFFPAYETYKIWKNVSDVTLLVIVFLILLRIKKIDKFSVLLAIPFIAILISVYLVQSEERYLIPAIPFLFLLWGKLYEKEIIKVLHLRKSSG